MVERVQIGDATLYCGDCLEVMTALDPADHLFTDPPYEAALHAIKNSLVGRKHRNDGVAEQKGLGFEGVDEIRGPFVDAASRICQGWFIAFCTVEGVSQWADFVNASPLKYKRSCIWVKPDSTPQLNGQGPAQGAECFVCAWGGSGYARWNAGGKRGVYTHLTNHPGRDGRHPTEKPISLMRELIADFTDAGQSILDPFMGSGTTGVACLTMGRRFVGVEIDRRYFDIACERIEKATRQADMFIAAPKAKQASLLLSGDAT